jgi:hypothetical protein
MTRRVLLYYSGILKKVRMIMKNSLDFRLFMAVGMAAILALAAGCTKSGGPDYTSEEEGGPDPAVNEKLADEAWQSRFVFHIGPVDLPKGQDAKGMVDKPLTMSFQTDEAVWVTAFQPKVVDTAGNELPSDLLHQAIVFNKHEENSLCSDGGSGNPIFVATSMLTEIELPQGFGYPVLPSDPLEAQVVLKNSTDKSYAGVYFELTLVARPMNEFTNLADVKPMLVEMDTCDHAPLTVEPGEFEEQKATYRMAQSSRLVVAFGALQDYGASVELTAGTELEPFWVASAELDENHKILQLSNSPYVDSGGVTFSAGDPIMFGVTYDNTSDKWLKTATAGAMVYVAPNE